MPIYAGGGTAGSVRITLSVYDTAGVLADGGTVVCTITKPDGTTTTATVVRDSEGQYHADYYPADPGQYGVIWTVTGINAGSLEESFTVDDITVFPPVSLAEVKQHLNMSSDRVTDDDELRAFILAATSAIEARVGPLTRRSVTESYSGGVPAIVLTAPAIEVTAVTESGTSLTASDYSLSPLSGVLTRVSGYSRSTWTSGFDNIAVTYDTGRTAIPADLRQAVLELIRHLWSTQRGQQGRTRTGDEFVAGQGYSLPNRVLELIAPYELPGIA